ncbi:MAG: hypothetical protein SV775_06750, partial [Thermodesulfobacteriota bacterium]|nr:hypothetical protein [Thermodesulfobacteriota bacterium]
MKCPKCSYVSFDYNKVCPKCEKDIAAEMERINFLSFRPNPPFLLSALIGETGEASTIQIEISGDSSGVPPEEGISPEDSQVIEPMEIAFEDSQEIDVQLGPTSGREAEESLEDVDLSDLAPETVETELQLDEPGIDLSLDETSEELSIGFEKTESGGPADQAVEEEITLELDDLEPFSSASPDLSETAVLEPSEQEDDGVSLELDGLSPEESGISLDEETIEGT